MHVKNINFFLHRLGNKQDCDGAMDENELHRRLGLDELKEKYKCPCQVVSFYQHKTNSF